MSDDDPLPKGPGGMLPGVAERSRDATLTADWSNDALLRLASICVELDCGPKDMLLVMMNESDARASAYNKDGGATGLIQIMPSNANWLGIVDMGLFRTWSAFDQLPYVKKYYMGHKGKLVNATAIYMATFVPAYMAHAGTPEWVIARKGHPIYDHNSGFDRARKGWIQVSDLTNAILRHVHDARYQELLARLDGLLERFGLSS